MSEVGNAPNGGGRGGGTRLLLRDPRLATRLARSLLAERRRLRGEGAAPPPRRRVLAPGGARELARSGGRIDPDLAFRALAHAIDPRWTAGHRFRVTFELTGDPAGRWTVTVDDGAIAVGDGVGEGANGFARRPFGSTPTTGGRCWRARSPRPPRCRPG